MRISDWSSDGCSSELAEQALGAEPCGQPADRGANLRVAADPADGAVVFGHPAYDSCSSSSMKPEMMPSPFDQKAGSEASSPQGCSRSLWRSVPPAFSMAKSFSLNPAPATLSRAKTIAHG